MNTKAVKLLLMFLFGQIVQTAVMLIGFALDMPSISWWTIVSGLVIFCAAWLGGCVAAPEAVRSKRRAKSTGSTAMDEVQAQTYTSKYID